MATPFTRDIFLCFAAPDRNAPGATSTWTGTYTYRGDGGDVDIFITDGVYTLDARLSPLSPVHQALASLVIPDEEAQVADGVLDALVG